MVMSHLHHPKLSKAPIRKVPQRDNDRANVARLHKSGSAKGAVQPQKQQPRSQESTMSLQSPTPTRQHEYYGIRHWLMVLNILKYL